MDKNDAQAEVEVTEAPVETTEETTEDVQDTTDWKAEHDAVLGRLKRAETKLGKVKVEKEVEKIVEKQKGELDETQLDYLDLKGISDEDDIDLIHQVMQKTGQTVRQVLKDDYVQERLAKNKAQREVKDAMPSSKGRNGNSQNTDLALAIAKFESTKELPADFELASKVVDAMQNKSNSNKPSWHQ